ncbi:MAG: peptidylprolyl isomerase [Bergeyella sp.]|nr:peptidylprolyl isomerase [Bergeyella sp.]
MIRQLICRVIIVVFASSCVPTYKKMNIEKEFYSSLKEGIYAKLQTSEGVLIIKLEDKDSPVTVASFVGLAEGKIDNSAKKKGVPFYDGTLFHRVIKGFMIQGGDPKGTGMGDPGYRFDDEKNALQHIGKGIVSMANSGPNTNGSQFFITEVATPWLDGRHTVFGKVIKGQEVIDVIAAVEKSAQDKPITDVVLERVSIFTKGDAYKNYDAEKIFREGKNKIQENNWAYVKKQELEAQKNLEKLKEGMKKMPSGLLYKVKKRGKGKKVEQGNSVFVHYVGKLTNGTEFDNSFERGEPIEFTAGKGQVIRGWDEGILLLQEGDEATFVIPPDLGYGSHGAGSVIPPNAWLVFDVQITRIK